MKRPLIAVILFTALLTGMLVYAAPTDRFMGGSEDGYEKSLYAGFYGNDLFKGGGLDGYDLSVTNNVIPPPQLMVFTLF